MGMDLYLHSYKIGFKWDISSISFHSSIKSSFYWKKSSHVTMTISILTDKLIGKCVWLGKLVWDSWKADTFSNNYDIRTTQELFVVWLLIRNDHRPLFSRNKDDNEASNGETYRNILEKFFWQQLENMNFVEMWFQEDVAICHIGGETIGLLK